MLVLFVGMLSGINTLPAGVYAQEQERCFTETGFCISGQIRAFWEQNGGLPVFGYPITEQRVETVEGRTIPVQWFERDRLEIQTNGSVTAGRLGAQLLEQRGTPWQSFPKAQQAPANCTYFAETGHSLCEPFLSYWRTNGGLDRFGFAITEPMEETLGDWTGTVQYFERRRMEHHPENAGTPYEVLLGLLGREALAGSSSGGGGGSANQCADAPTPVSANIRPSNCIEPGTQLEFDIFGFQPNEEIGFWITRPDGEIFGTEQALDEVIDSNGSAQGITWDTTDYGPGLWTLTFQGAQSGHQAIVYFKVIGSTVDDPSEPTPPWVDAPQCADVPASTNATLLPGNCIERGQIYIIELSGFQPNEPVGYWFITPDGQQVNRTQQAVEGIIGSDGTGSDYWFTNEADPGVWSVVYEGAQSGHQAVGYVKIVEPGILGMTPDNAQYCPEVPDPVNGDPIPGKCLFAGNVVILSVSGFSGGESVGFWFTAPDGSVSGTHETATMPADGSGQLGPFYTGTMQRGIWSLTVQGTTTNHSAVVYFKVVDPVTPEAAPSERFMQCGDHSIELPINAEVSPGVCLNAGDQQANITFNGFEPGETITTRLTGANERNGPESQRTADPDGRYSYVFNIDRFTDAYGYGKYVFYVESADKEHFAKVELVVKAP
jgi:hypothetical protein